MSQSNALVVGLADMKIGEAARTLYGQLDWSELTKHGVLLSPEQVLHMHRVTYKYRIRHFWLTTSTNFINHTTFF